MNADRGGRLEFFSLFFSFFFFCNNFFLFMVERGEERKREGRQTQIPIRVVA